MFAALRASSMLPPLASTSRMVSPASPKASELPRSAAAVPDAQLVPCMGVAENPIASDGRELPIAPKVPRIRLPIAPISSGAVPWVRSAPNLEPAPPISRSLSRMVSAPILSARYPTASANRVVPLMAPPRNGATPYSNVGSITP